MQSDWYEPKWDPTDPATPADIGSKFAALTKNYPEALHIGAAIGGLPHGSYKSLRDRLLGPL